MTTIEVRDIIVEELKKAGLSVQGGDASTQNLDEELLQENPAAIVATALRNPQLQQMLINMIMPMIQKALQAKMGGQAGTAAGAYGPAGKPATGTV